MLNQDDFIKRLYQIFEHYSLTAALFADEIKAQRSSISHLLSGRNKPSLEFVLKIVAHYKEVTLDWLVYGKGVFPKTYKLETTNDLFSEVIETSKSLPPKSLEKENSITDHNINDIKKTTPSEIERIVVFYKNGIFKEYTQGA